MEVKDRRERIRIRLCWLRTTVSTGFCEQSNELSVCESRTRLDISLVYATTSPAMV